MTPLWRLKNPNAPYKLSTYVQRIVTQQWSLARQGTPAKGWDQDWLFWGWDRAQACPGLSQTPICLSWALSQTCHNGRPQWGFSSWWRDEFDALCQRPFFPWPGLEPALGTMGWAAAQQKEFAEMAGSEVCRAECIPALFWHGAQFWGDIAVNLKLLNALLHCPSQELLL